MTCLSIVICLLSGACAGGFFVGNRMARLVALAEVRHRADIRQLRSDSAAGDAAVAAADAAMDRREDDALDAAARHARIRGDAVMRAERWDPRRDLRWRS